MKYSILLFAAFVLVSCKKDNTQLPSSSVAQDSLAIANDSTLTTTKTEKIAIETFAFPTEIKECSCYFAKNKSDFENEKYIYADDAGKTAYMKIEGKRLVMNLLSSSDMESDDELSKEIENNDYKISVKGKKIKHEEAMLFDGTITIEKTDGTIVKIPIYGECAC